MKYVQLGELGDFKNGVNFKSDRMGRGLPLVNVKDITSSHRIDPAALDLVDVKTDEELFADTNDIFFVRSSVKLDGIALVGKFSFIESPAIHCGFVIRFRPVSTDLCSDYLLYLLLSQEYRQRLKGLSGGAAIVNISQASLKSLPIPLPAYDVQRKIASILSTYDDLIENNRRRMALLEESARLLYREWFVRLRFPGHEHMRIIDGVPEGWVRRSLVDTCASLEDGDWIESKDQGGEDYRLLQISNIGMNEFVETGNFRYVTEQTFKRLRCREILPGQILISRMPKPIGRAWLVTEMPWKMITAVDGAILIPNPEIADPYFLIHHLNSPENVESCERRAVGATRPRISRRELASLPVLVPPFTLQRDFREVAEPLNQQRANLYRQNQKLRAARDLLLPRLMSGEIAV